MERHTLPSRWRAGQLTVNVCACGDGAGSRVGMRGAGACVLAQGCPVGPGRRVTLAGASVLSQVQRDSGQAQSR